MYINKNKQTGSMYSTVFIVLVLIFAAVTGMKLWAPFYDDLAVKTALKNISEEESTALMGPKDILKTLNTRLQVNNVSLNKDEVKIKREDGVIDINVVYERRIPMYGNVDALVHFEHSASVKSKR